MSKTYKTQPRNIRIANGHLHAQAVHDHSGLGACDLLDIRELKKEDQSDRNCTWEYCYTGVNDHSCPTCSDHWGRDKKRVKRRRTERSEALMLARLFNNSGSLEYLEDVSYAKHDVRTA